MITDKLMLIQKELKAPKKQFNKFGGFKYRSCEDILEAVKPLLTKHNCALVLTDELVMIGDRYYIKASAVLKDSEGYECVMAYAREDESKRGMDGAQITGTASSYARKYALNGLFCIDDTKDSDTNEVTQQAENAQEEKKTSEKDTKLFKVMELTVDADITEAQLLAFLKDNDAKLKASSIKELTIKYLDFVIDNWDKLSSRIKKDIKYGEI